MPKTCERPEVIQVAKYLKRRPNRWVPREEIGAKFGIKNKRMCSILTSLSEVYPQIAEEDRWDGRKRVHLMWVRED